MVSLPLAGLAAFALLKWVTWGADPDVRARGGTAELGVWEYLISISVMLWVLLAGVGLSMMRQLAAEVDAWQVQDEKSAPRHHRRRETIYFVFFVYALTAVPLVIGGAAGLRNPYILAGQNWKIPLLHALAGVAILPMLVVLKRIQQFAADGTGWSTTARDIARLRVLRRLMRVATAALGGVIALSVIASGALRQATAAAGLTPLPDSFVLVYGASFTGVVAAVYLYVFGAVEARGRRLLETAGPLPDPSAATAEAFSASRALRGDLARELELGGDPRSDLQGLLAVLSPLIGALLTRIGGL